MRLVVIWLLLAPAASSTCAVMQGDGCKGIKAGTAFAEGLEKKLKQQ